MTAERVERRKYEGDLTVQEAGRRGGQKVRAKYGRDFYVRIGGLGGRVISEKMRGTDFFQGIGKKGGDSTVDRHGREHLRDIGRIGGEAVKARSQEHDSDYYARIGQKGGRKKQEARKAGKQE